MTSPTDTDTEPEQGSSLRRKAVVGGLWTAVQYIYGNFASTVAFIVLARLVAPASFGVVSLAAVFVQITLLLSDLGVTPTLIRSRSMTDARLSTGFWLGVGISWLLCLNLEVLAGPIAHWLHEPRFEAVLRVLVLSIPVQSAGSVPIVVLSRQLRMKPQAIRQLISVTVATGGAIIMAFFGLGIWSLVFQDCGTVAIDTTVLWLAISWRPRLSFSIAEARDLLGFGLKVTVTQLVHQGRDRGGELIIGRVLGAQALGFYVVATRIAELSVQMFASVLNAIALPAFAQVQNEPDRLHRAIKHAVRVTGTAALPSMLALAALSPVLIPFIFGSEWQTTGDIAQITAVTSALIAFQYLDGNIWWTLGKPGVELRLVSGITVGQLAIVWWMSHYGLIAIAFGLLGRALISIPVRLITLVRRGGVPWWVYAEVPMILVVSGVMYGIMRLTGALLHGQAAIVVILSEMAVAVLSYGALSWLLQRDNILEFRRDIMAVVGRA